MADKDLATRAPESDAQEDIKEDLNAVESAEGISGIPRDTKVDQGAASLGVSCGRRAEVYTVESLLTT